MPLAREWTLVTRLENTIYKLGGCKDVKCN